MVKQKQTRTYDVDGFRKRAACLCVRDDTESEILLVTSSRRKDGWIVPGGGVEPNEKPFEAAIRETEEEAGVKGYIKRCLGDFEVRDQNQERKHRTSVFVLHVQEELDEWEDSKSRKRRWFPLEEALQILTIHKPVQVTYVRLLVHKNSPSSSSISEHVTANSSNNNAGSSGSNNNQDEQTNNTTTTATTRNVQNAPQPPLVVSDPARTHS